MTRGRTLAVGWGLALLAMAGFARLGFWQYDRMHEKQALLDRAATVLRERIPLALDSDVVSRPSWVSGTGTIDPRTLLLDNQMHDGRAGVRVYCVLHLGTPAGDRLIDLGWAPVAGDRTLPDVACPAGRLDVQGLMIAPPSSGIRMGAAMQAVGPQRWLMTRVDTDAIGDALHVRLVSAVVRLDPALRVGYARDLDVLPNTLPPERHLGYAVQWWALSLAVFATALLLTFRKKRRA